MNTHNQNYSHFYDFNFYNVKYYFILFSALSLAIFTGIYSLLIKYFRSMEYLSGVLIVNIILMFLLHFLVPTGSYLVIVPLFLLLTGGILCFSLRISMATKKRSWIVPMLALVVSAAGFFLAHLNSKVTPEKPLQTSLNYYFDADSSCAYWVSEFLDPDEWNSQFFENGIREPLTEIYPHAERVRLKNPAPVIIVTRR